MEITQIYQALIESAALIIIAIAGLAVTFLKIYATRYIKNKELQTSLKVSLDMVVNSVKSTILGLSVDAKKAIADGNISPEDLKLIQLNAIDRFKENVAPSVQKIMVTHIQDLEKMVLDIVDAEVQKADKITSV